MTDISWSAISDVSVKLKSNFFANGYIADGYFQALQNMPRQNIGQKKLRKKKKKNTQVIYLGWIVSSSRVFCENMIARYSDSVSILNPNARNEGTSAGQGPVGGRTWQPWRDPLHDWLACPPQLRAP